MKRDPALQSLSRDHHQALAIALRLVRCDADAVEHVQAAFLRYWHEHGLEHFRAEEEILLPAFADYADAGHPLIARVLVDHHLIRHHAARIQREADEPLWRVRELGTLLSDHVRLEERELFPLIEEYLPPEELDWLLHALEHAEEAARPAPARS